MCIRDRRTRWGLPDRTHLIPIDVERPGHHVMWGARSFDVDGDQVCSIGSSPPCPPCPDESSAASCPAGSSPPCPPCPDVSSAASCPAGSSAPWLACTALSSAAACPTGSSAPCRRCPTGSSAPCRRCPTVPLGLGVA